MSDNIELTYRRVGERFQGTLDSLEFSGITYADMMMKAHLRLLAQPTAGLLIKRTDKEGLMPVALDPPMLALLRTDPVKYIKLHSVPDRVVDLTGGKKRRVGDHYDVPKHSGLRIGHDTLADSFGDRVYLRLHNSKVEHPVTGRWVPLLDIERTFLPHELEIMCVEDASGGWVTVGTSNLLCVDTDRYYLPRAWNSYGNWITKDQLRDMYEQFNKDRDNAIQQ